MEPAIISVSPGREVASRDSTSYADLPVCGHAGTPASQRTDVSACRARIARMLWSISTLLAFAFACASLIAAGPETAIDFAQKEKELRTALELARSSHGGDAELTLHAMGALAECLQMMGKFPEAETLRRGVIERMLKSTLEDSLAMAEPYDRLGALLTEMHKFGEASEILQKALKIHEKANHTAAQDYALVLSDLGSVKLRDEKPADAEPLFRRSLDLQRKLFAEDDPALAAAYANLGAAIGPLSFDQQDEKRKAEAEELLRRALDLETQSATGTLQRQSVYLSYLGAHLADLGRLTEAEKLMRQALDIDVRLFGDFHPDTIVRLQHLGSITWRLGRVKEAEPYLERAVEACATYWGEESVLTANACHEAGKLLFALSRIKAAEEEFRRALAIREKLLGPDHVKVAKTLHNVACVEIRKGKLPEAEMLFKRVLAIDEKAYGLVDLHVADDLDHLAGVQLAQRKWLTSEKTQQRLLDIVVEKLGKEHPRSIIATAGLAYIYLGQSRRKEAEELMRASRDLVARTHGGNHPLLAVFIAALAGIQAEDGRVKEGEFQCRKALGILTANEKENGVTPAVVAQALHTYITILNLFGLSQEQITDRIDAIRKGADPGPVPKPLPPSRKKLPGTNTV